MEKILDSIKNFITGKGWPAFLIIVIYAPALIGVSGLLFWQGAIGWAVVNLISHLIFLPVVIDIIRRALK